MSTAKTNAAQSHQHHHAHHFDSAEHEYDTSKQGVWAFLVTEILMFGGLFVAYAIFHHLYPEIFRIGSTFTDWRMGAANTVVLLTSSLTMALGIYYIQTGKPDRSFVMLAITVVCGAIFHINEHGIEELKHRHPELVNVPTNLALYFSFYYMMTGLHGIHVLLGMGLIIWVMIRLKRGDFNPHYYTAVEGVGLFWHLVDLVWIYLFPLLYLVT
jgi:cytochrome c oxidase subunit 3